MKIGVRINGWRGNAVGVCSGLLLSLQGCGTGLEEIRRPEGYRVVDESEYSNHAGRWEPGRFPTPDRAVGDFDGDSEVGQARVWVHEGGERWILMAYLSTRPGNPVTVYESGRRAELAQRPIRAVPPGVHQTHRYFGFGPGGPDTTAVVVLTHEAIHLARTESEGVVFVWNAGTETFDPVDMY